MMSSPRYIHFRVGWQFFGPESPGQWFSKEDFRKLYDALSNAPLTADYHDFIYRDDRCEIIQDRGDQTGEGKAFSKVVCQPDEITIVEEWAEISVPEFIDKFEIVLKAWFQCFPRTLLLVQQSCLRALVQPSNFNDSRDFLGGKVLCLADRLKKTFTEMPFKIGFTVGCQKDIHGQPLIIDVAANSWRDNRSVWTEVTGISPLARPVNAANAEATRLTFEACRDFAVKEVFVLLEGFDRRDEGVKGTEGSE